MQQAEIGTLPDVPDVSLSAKMPRRPTVRPDAPDIANAGTRYIHCEPQVAIRAQGDATTASGPPTPVVIFGAGSGSGYTVASTTASRVLAPDPQVVLGSC